MKPAAKRQKTDCSAAETELRKWQLQEVAAEAAAPIMGKLYRDKNVVTW